MTKRQVAHITLEADTPLKVGSANSDFLQDSPIQKDWNGLPMILGTSIAGVLRKDFEGDDNDIFGYDCSKYKKKKEDKEKYIECKKREKASKVIISNALLLDENQKVNEGLLLAKSDFLQLFDNLPIREHTAITDKGVAKEHSKFDEEVVYKGSRFRFSIEMLDEEEAFKRLIELLQSPSFRLGGGSTKGFGKFKVLSIEIATLETTEQLAKYSSSLNAKLINSSRVDLSTTNSKTHIQYTLTIKPDDFFMFGSGFGDEDGDQTAVVEKIVDYEKKGLSKNHILIPASSLKGALAHRTTYHYNLNSELYIGNKESREVIDELFGEAKNSKKEVDGSRGKALFSDVYKLDRDEHKIFDHVAIDRFTGGGIDGALFQEKTVAQSDEWTIEILLENGVDEPFVKAFEQSLDDVCSGMLPLGGATTKGHGVFTGTWESNHDKK